MVVAEHENPLLLPLPGPVAREREEVVVETGVEGRV